MRGGISDEKGGIDIASPRVPLSNGFFPSHITTLASGTTQNGQRIEHTTSRTFIALAGVYTGGAVQVLIVFVHLGQSFIAVVVHLSNPSRRVLPSCPAKKDEYPSYLPCTA